MNVVASNSFGITKLVIAVTAIIITINGPMIPADTAAFPITRAPTMLTAEPIGLGRRMPASFKISNVMSMISASTSAGKGTLESPAVIEKSSGVGTSSWWNVVMAT